MKRLKYIVATVVLAMGFASCETEAVDEKLKDDTLTVKPILRFELNDKQTVVTDRVVVSWPTNSEIVITAKFSVMDPADSNEETRYKPATLTIKYNNFSMSNFPTKLSVQNPTSNLVVANLNIQNVGNFSSSYAKESEDAGYSNITKIMYEEKIVEGNFDFILYPNSSTLKPQRLKNGNYNYLKY